MNRLDVSETIAKNFSLPIRDADKIVGVFLDTIKRGLLNKEKISFRGFGSFNIVRRKGHIGQDLRNKKSVIIPDHDVIVFSPSENILKNINKTLEK